MDDVKLLVEQQAGKITFNYEETKAFLEEKMEEFNGITFSDDTMKYAKATIASLRKLKAQMDDERKKVKSAWMSPYTEFETKVKEMLALIDKPIGYIDSQVKEYDERRRQQKLEVCKYIYAEEIGDMQNFLPFDKVYDPKWLNVSITEKSIRETISDRVSAVREQIHTIEMMDSEAVSKALEIFRDTLDMTKAITHINEYEAMKREIEERDRKRQEEENDRKIEKEREQIRREERAKIKYEKEFKQNIREETLTELKEVSQETKDTSVILPGSETVLYAVTGTKEELKDLEITMMSLGICFERKG